MSNSDLSFRTVWISDVHLGFKGCRADLLLDFLKQVKCDTLYLVGDIIDIWSLRKTFYWPTEHNQVVRRIMKLASKGVRVIYVPGNHDEDIRAFVGQNFGGIEIHRSYTHETVDGRRLLILHGDEFDHVVQNSPMLAAVGASAYAGLLKANRLVNAVRSQFGYEYWSLANFLKQKVKNAVHYIGKFEEAVAETAAEMGVDGLVCGHIHRAEMRDINGVLYCNDGDWVESCTALAETADGELRLLDWVSMQAAASAPAALANDSLEAA